MKKRIFLEESRGICHYRLEDDGTTTYFCTPDDWAIYKIEEELVVAGADKKLVEKLRRLSYKSGYEEATKDYQEQSY
jgi:hypothetical protein